MALLVWRAARVFCTVVSGAFLFAGALGAQWGNECSIRLEVRQLGAVRNLTARISGTTFTTTSPLSGETSIGPLPCGDYEVIVLSDGKTVHQEMVTVSTRDEHVEMQVNLPAEPARTGPGTVSVHELRAAKTAGEFRKALRALAKDDYPSAETHLLRVLKANPMDAEAHNNLGVCYVRNRRVTEALAEFGRAAALRPSARAHTNLSLALARLERYAEGERAAREALRLDQAMPQAHLALGINLKGQAKEPDVAMRELRRVTSVCPAAHLHLAELLHRQRRTAEEIEEVRAYLDSGDTTLRPEAEHLLAMLTGH